MIHSFVDPGHRPSRTVKRLSKRLSKRCKKDLKQKKDYKIHYLFLYLFLSLLLWVLGRGGDECCLSFLPSFLSWRYRVVRFVAAMVFMLHINVVGYVRLSAAAAAAASIPNVTDEQRFDTKKTSESTPKVNECYDMRHDRQDKNSINLSFASLLDHFFLHGHL